MTNSTVINRNPALILAGVVGLAAVAIGAAGDHMMDADMDARAAEIFDTALRYHQVYSIVLLVTALPGVRTILDPAVWIFTAGTLVFCGSLYALSLTGVSLPGMITPVGGVLLMAGWAAVIWRGIKPRES